MHPNRRFDWTDRDEIYAFVADIAFCSIFATGAEGPAVLHVPVVVAGPDRIRFHVSRANRGVEALERGPILLSCVGPDAYISPDWYGTDDQVPTWNYVAVEAEGRLRRLSDEELAGQLDSLSAAHEARLAPKPPWTRDKMSPGRFEAMLKGIVGFELAVETLRGSRKLGQNKKGAEMDGAIAGLEAAGRADMAALMRDASSSYSSPSRDGEGAHAQHGGGVSAQASKLPLHHPPAADGPPPPASRREES
jgi:transcriptional regulator